MKDQEHMGFDNTIDAFLERSKWNTRNGQNTEPEKENVETPKTKPRKRAAKKHTDEEKTTDEN